MWTVHSHHRHKHKRINSLSFFCKKCIPSTPQCNLSRGKFIQFNPFVSSHPFSYLDRFLLLSPNDMSSARGIWATHGSLGNAGAAAQGGAMSVSAAQYTIVQLGPVVPTHTHNGQLDDVSTSSAITRQVLHYDGSACKIVQY